MTNIVTHGGLKPFQNDISVQLAIQETEATLTICDGGQLFDPTQVPSPEKVDLLEEAPVGGLGLHLVKQFSSGMEYLRRDGINQLVIRFDNASSQVPEAR